MKEEETIKRLSGFFLDVIEEDEKYIKELKKYVELDSDLIKDREKEIREYLNHCEKKNYESIEELKEDVKKKIEMNR